jgi:hypothetical protein
MEDGSVLRVKVPEKQLVFHLTHNWSPRGTPVEWGLLPIMNRLKCIDIYNNYGWFDQIMTEAEKQDEGKKRDFNNTVESFMYEFRDAVKKTTSDVVVTNRRF